MPFQVTAEGIPVDPLAPAGSGPLALRRRPGHVGIAQRVDIPDPAAANAQALEDLEDGADALVLVAAGAPTARGFGGQAQDLGMVLEGVHLEMVGLRLESSPFEDTWRAALLREVRARRLDPALLDIGFGLDPVGDMLRLGWAPATWTDVSRRFSDEVLTLSGFGGAWALADGRPVHEAGGGEAQELATVVGSALWQWRALEAAGLDADQARRHLSTLLVADTDEVMTLAKFRALRRLWAAIETAGGVRPEPIRLHAETAWRALTRRDAATNLVRGTLACAAAILGGADAVTVLPFTAALGLPDAAARRLARNTPLILLGEAGLARSLDPAAGAGGIEALTTSLCERAWTLLQRAEQAGGLPSALAQGWWQAEIAETAARRRAAFAAGETAIVGVSAYAAAHEESPPVLAAAPGGHGLTPLSGGVRVAALPSRRDAQPFEPSQARP